MVLVFFLEQFFKETHWCVLCVWIEVVLPAFIGNTWFPCPQWNYEECPCLLSIMTREHANVLLSVINLNGQELGICSRVARLKGNFCFDLRMCRNGSCSVVMELMDANTGRLTNFWAEIFSGDYPLLYIWLDTHILHVIHSLDIYCILIEKWVHLVTDKVALGKCDFLTAPCLLSTQWFHFFFQLDVILGIEQAEFHVWLAALLFWSCRT